MRKTLLFIWMLGCSLSMQARFSGSGSGTADDPYLITDGWELYDIFSDLTAHYKLMADIDMAAFLEEIEMEDEGWEPIGTSNNPFTGTFDGNGKAISGLYINRPSANHVGLFGYTNNASIHDLVISNANIRGNDNVGVVMGYGANTIVSDIQTNNVNVAGSQYVGGLVGYLNSGSVSSITQENTTVTGTGNIGGLIGIGMGSITGIIQETTEVSCSGGITGGLVGQNTGSVRNISARNVSVEGTTHTGGLIGLKGDSTSIVGINMHIVSVIGTDYVGGAIGQCQSNVMNAKITFPIVNGNNYVGGCIGEWVTAATTINNDCYVQNCHVVGGGVNGNTDVGGIIGSAKRSRYTIFNIYYYIKKCYASANIHGVENVGGICGNVASNYMKYVQRNNPKVTVGANCIYPKIIDNRYDGTICGGTNVSGIIGYINRYTTGQILSSSYQYEDLFKLMGEFERNIVTGSVIGTDDAIGILGNKQTSCTGIDNYWSVAYNGCLLDTLLSASETAPRRIGEVGTDNFASNKTVVMANGEVVEVAGAADNENGISKSEALLKRNAGYTTYGFDFENTWTIVQGKTFPYNVKQCAPGEITSMEVGSTTVAGTAPADGKVYVFIGENMYEGTISSGLWQVETCKIRPSMEIRMAVETDADKYPSVVVTAFTEKAHVNEETLTLSSQYATFCSTVAIDFSALSDVKAYAVGSKEGGKVVLTRVMSAPAGEGLVLKGTPGTYPLTRAVSAEKPTNLLVGVTEDTEIGPTQGDNTNFVLASGSHGVGFYRVSQVGTLAAGKAYLPLPTDDIAGARSFVMEFVDDDISGISTTVADVKDSAVMFDLSGRVIGNAVRSDNALRKGIYVRQGKKIIVK